MKKLVLLSSNELYDLRRAGSAWTAGSGGIFDPRANRLRPTGRTSADAAASVDISQFPRQARIVLQGLKTYGMILADNGSNWYISGAPDPGLR